MNNNTKSGKVLMFPKQKQTVKARFVQAESRENLFSLEVSGDSLSGLGILEGDLLICRDIDKNEVENGQLIIAIVADYGSIAKYYYRSGNQVTLRSANPRYKDLVVPAKSVDIKAIAVSFQRSLEAA